MWQRVANELCRIVLFYSRVATFPFHSGKPEQSLSLCFSDLADVTMSPKSRTANFWRNQMTPINSRTLLSHFRFCFIHRKNSKGFFFEMLCPLHRIRWHLFNDHWHLHNNYSLGLVSSLCSSNAFNFIKCSVASEALKFSVIGSIGSPLSFGGSIWSMFLTPSAS